MRKINNDNLIKLKQQLRTLDEAENARRSVISGSHDLSVERCNFVDVDYNVSETYFSEIIRNKDPILPIKLDSAFVRWQRDPNFLEWQESFKKYISLRQEAAELQGEQQVKSRVLEDAVNFNASTCLKIKEQLDRVVANSEASIQNIDTSIYNFLDYKTVLGVVLVGGSIVAFAKYRNSKEISRSKTDSICDSENTETLISVALKKTKFVLNRIKEDL